MPALLESGHQRGGVDAVDGRFSGRINGRHIDRVRIVEGGAEVLHQVAQPGEAMRLDDSDDAARRPFPRGGQHGADFHRMMGVIVDYCGDPALAGNLAHLGEAPLHTAEAGKSVADRTIVYAKLTDRKSTRLNPSP